MQIMDILFVIVALLVAGLAIWRLLRSRDGGIRSRSISVGDIGDVYRQISSQGVETSFAVFVITPSQWHAEDTVEVQFSVENGVTGLDWILLSESNKREKPRVIQYALNRSMEWRECEMNDWPYLRIEQNGLVELCNSLIKDLWGVEEVLLKYGGFDYR